MTRHTLVYQKSRYSPLASDLEIMRKVGFQGIEISASKMRDVLAAGYTEDELASWLRDVCVPGIGFLVDIERMGEQNKVLMSEARHIFRLARIANARGVQVLTGPVQVQAVEAYAAGEVSDLYEGVLRLPRTEQVRVTARNLARLADLAAEQGLLLYLEALAWTPLNRLSDQIEIIQRTERPNVRMVVDFWHCYASGEKPDDVAKLDKNLIYGVHVCDSLSKSVGIPNEAVLRDVPTGEGVLRLKQWVDAVKATGYEGWWSCELFCRRQHLANSFSVAADLKSLMDELI